MGLLSEKHTYSYSQLNSFSECAYGFYLQKIEGLEEQASNAFAERGTLIHDLLDQWAKKKLDKQGMLEEYVRRYPEEVVTAFPRLLSAKGYTAKAYQQGLDFIEGFDEFEGFKVLSAEEKFKIELPLKDGTTRPFVGIIDMMLEDLKTNELVICDHKSKSLTSFKKNENEMYRQQLLYSTYVKQQYGKYPDRMMFHLFNESGVKMERLFSVDDYNDTISWASQQIEGIENYTMIDWLMCKEKPDFYCWELCSARKACPNGIMPDTKSRKRKTDYDEFGKE